MAIRDQRYATVSKQTTLSDTANVGLPERRKCGRGLNRSVYEGMNDISNVNVNLRTRSGNVNI